MWLPNKSAVVKSEIREFNSWGAGDAQLLICHDVQVVDEGLSVQRESYYSGNPFMMPRDLARDRLVLSNPIIGHTICVSTQLLRSAVNFLRPSQYMMHDWAIVLLASRLGTIKFVPKTLSLYRQHADNILGAYGRRSWREIAHRTFLFSFGVVRQSNIFFSDLSEARKISPDLVPRLILFDRCLVRIAQHFPSGNFLFLAGCAFLRGPTLQRRLLSGVLMVAGFWKILGLPEPTMKRKKR